MMVLPEQTMHSFIIRIWLEEEPHEGSAATWRGHIEHVPSKEKRYFKDLNDIVTIIKPYIEAMTNLFDGPNGG